MKYKKYKFKSYNKKFLLLYNKEKQKLQRFLPKNAKIEHIGSTAIPNLGGKGIIDIAIAVQKRQLNKIKRELENNKYEFIKSGRDKDRMFFQKNYIYNKKIRRVHIQLTYQNSNCWKKAIAFRNYLINHPNDVKKYAKIKRTASELCPEKGITYREYKKEFIDKILNKALKMNSQQPERFKKVIYAIKI